MSLPAPEGPGSALRGGDWRAVVDRVSGRPVRLFLALGGLFVLLFAALTPPLGAPDEHVHLVRAFLVAEGRLGVPGRAPHARETIPRSLLALHRDLAHPGFLQPPRTFSREEILGLFGRPLEPRRRAPAGFLGTYGPLAYAPQALAMLPARLAGAGPVELVYLGRLGNAMAFLAAGSLALALAPRRRLALALLLLSPMAVALGGSLSADVPTLAVTLLLTTLCWRLGLAPRACVSGREAAALVVLCGLLALVKPGYVLLACLVMFIPGERFGGRRRALRIRGAALAAVLLTSLLWTGLAVAADPPPAAAQADPDAQLRFILQNPGAFLSVLARSLVAHLPGLLKSGVGVLGHLNIPLPAWVYVLAPLALAGAVVSDRPAPPVLTPARRALLLGLGLTSFMLLMVLGYLGWNPVGAPLIRGIQGRYLAPILPLFLLAVPAFGRDPEASWVPAVRLACVLSAIAFLLASLRALLVASYA